MEEINNESVSPQVRNPEKLRITLKVMAEEIALGISLEEFRNTLKTLQKYSSAASALYDLRKREFVGDIHANIDSVYSEYKIDEKYNSVTKLINENHLDKDTVAWRPTTGDVQSQIKPYRIRSLLKRKEDLQKLVQEERDRRILMKNTLDKKRNYLKNQLELIQSVKTKLMNYSDICKVNDLTVVTNN